MAADVEPSHMRAPLDRAMQAIEGPWERARRRWGPPRVAIVFARDSMPVLSPWDGSWSERSPSFTVHEGATAAGETVAWAHRGLQARRWDAVLLVAAGSTGVAVLLLERQGSAACESLGVLSLADDDDAIRAVGVPDWILGHGEAPAWTGAAVPRVQLVPCGEASLVFKLATVTEVLQTGRPPAGLSFDAAGAPDLDAGLVWALQAEPTTRVAPIRFRV